MAKTLVGPATRADIVEQYNTGLFTVAQIADQQMFSSATIYRVLREEGIVLRSAMDVQLTNEQQADIITEAASGVSSGRISRKYDVPYAVVQATLLEAGILRDQTKKVQAARQDRWDRIVAEYEAGTPLYQICEAFGCSTPSIYQQLRKRGIPTRQQDRFMTMYAERQARLEGSDGGADAPVDGETHQV